MNNSQPRKDNKHGRGDLASKLVSPRPPSRPAQVCARPTAYSLYRRLLGENHESTACNRSWSFADCWPDGRPGFTGRETQ